MPNRLLGETPTISGDRDATHVAMISVRAQENFAPGEKMGKDGTRNNPIGIADPFRDKIQKGDLVWLCLKPGTTTDMTHHWSHPEFPSEVKDTAYYRKRLSELLEGGDTPTTLEGFLNFVGRCSNEGDYLYAAGFDAHGSIPDEVWDCVEALTGDDHGRPGGFSCSC